MLNTIRSTNVRAALKSRAGQVRNPEWTAKLAYKTALALNKAGIPTHSAH